eukprot:jgi/Ulvmu1/8232/UM041_0042.1
MLRHKAASPTKGRFRNSLRRASDGPAFRTVAVRCIPTAPQPSKVVCVGEALFDMLANDKGKARADVTSWTGYPGGAPCNVACGLGKLGIPVAFVSSLGNDDKGNELLGLMKSRGVDTSAVERVSHATRDVYVIRTMEGDRIFDSFGQDTNTYCDCFISADRLPKNAIENAEVLVMGTLGLAYPDTKKAMHEAMSLAKEADTLVMIDCNWRPVFWDAPDSALDIIRPFLEQGDLVKITDEEAEWAFGIPAAEAMQEPARVLHMLPNAHAVLVTGGGAGAAFCVRAAGGMEQSGFVPVYDVDVQDTTGAGDAFTCGFLAYLLSKGAGKAMREALGNVEDTTEAVKFAAACGALTTLAGGAIAAQPDRAEVEKMVQSRNHF